MKLSSASSLLVKKAICVALLFAALVITLCGFSGCAATSSKGDTDNGFYIKNLDVTMDASAADRSVLVTESYTLRFLVSDRHGLYRDITLNSGEKVRGLKVLGFGAADNSFSADKYEVNHEGEAILRVKIGDTDKTVPKDKDIALKITYTLLTPKVKNLEDTLKLNIIGSGWTCKIEKAQLKVILPIAANSMVAHAMDSPVAVTSSENGLVNTISIQDTLQPHQGVWASFAMPKGTFKARLDTRLIATIIGCAIFLLIMVIIKFTVGKSAPIKIVKSVNPPKVNGKQLTPLENGYLIDSKCSASDITSLIFYWASKGYLSFSEKGGLTLTKVTDYSGDKKYEKQLFERIFKSGNVVRVDCLNHALAPFVAEAANAIKAQYKNKLYCPKVKVVRMLCIMAVTLLSIASIMVAYFSISSKYFNVFWFIFIPIALVEFFGVYIADNYIKLDKRLRGHIIVLILLAIGGTTLTGLVVNVDAISVLELFVLLGTVTICLIIAPFISKRTKQYNQILGEVVGFRDFIKYVDKQQLETILITNPQFFYEILPYANVLGVSTIWQDKFKDIALPQPSYYKADNAVFSIVMFNTFYRSAHDTFIQSAFSPSSSGSSNDGGYNSSGGGFGSDGGGSW